MLEPKEHYGKLHRQYHSPVPKTTTQSPAKVLKFIAVTLLHTGVCLPAVQSRIGWPSLKSRTRRGRKAQTRLDLPFAAIHKIGNWSISYSGKAPSTNPPIYPD